jgi:hypothetical protein
VKLTPCGPVLVHWRFVALYCLHLQGLELSKRHVSLMFFLLVAFSSTLQIEAWYRCETLVNSCQTMWHQVTQIPRFENPKCNIGNVMFMLFYRPWFYRSENVGRQELVSFRLLYSSRPAATLFRFPSTRCPALPRSTPMASSFYPCKSGSSSAPSRTVCNALVPL